MAATPDGALELATKLLRLLEGCTIYPYLDVAGVPTIGIGCTRLNGQPVTMRTPAITQAQADAACRFELGATERMFDNVIRIPLTAGQWAACASLAYNIGGGAFTGSTLLRHLNAGDTTGAAGQFAIWDRAGGRVQVGLVHRRAIEAAVFRLGVIPGGGASVKAPVVRPVTVPAHYTPADELNMAELSTLLGGTP